MVRLVSHINGDLDSRCSLWVYERFVAKGDCAFRFVPANYDGKDAMIGDVILDVDAGGLGIKGKHVELPGGGTRVMSCFGTLLEQVGEPQRTILQPLCELVEAQDSTGDGVFEIMRSSRLMVGHPDDARTLEPDEVPAAIRATGLVSVMRSIDKMYGKDSALAEVQELQRYLKFRDILDGLALVWLEHHQAAEKAKSAKWVGKVAIVGDGGVGVNGYLFEAGAKLIVYTDGNNLGIVRGRGLESRLTKDWARGLIERLAPKEEHSRWFYHPSGFLSAHGSIKAPATNPSSIPAGVLAEELARLVAIL